MMNPVNTVFWAFKNIISLAAFVFTCFLIAVNWYAINAWLASDPDALNPPADKASNPPPTSAQAMAAYLGAWRKDWLERPASTSADRAAIDKHRDAREELSNIVVSDCAWTRLTEQATPPEAKNRAGKLPKGAYRCRVKVSYLSKRAGGAAESRSTEGYFFRDGQSALHYVGPFPH
jgi:hypothetical protein